MDITDSNSTEVLQLQRELRLLKEKLKPYFRNKGILYRRRRDIARKSLGKIVKKSKEDERITQK